MNKVIDILKKYYKVALVVLVLLLIIIIIISNKKSNEYNEIINAIDKKQTKIVYVGSNNYNKCTSCKDITNVLDEYEIEYIKYDVDICSNREYKKMLQKIGIDQHEFKSPGIIYIKDGKVHSNINNSPDENAVRDFVRKYQLKPIR